MGADYIGKVLFESFICVILKALLRKALFGTLL